MIDDYESDELLREWLETEDAKLFWGISEQQSDLGDD